MCVIRQLLSLLFSGNLRNALQIYDIFLSDEKERRRLHSEMKELGLLILGRPEDSLFESFSPATCPGSAAKFANAYGIKLWVGTCHSEVRAILPREKWKYPIDKCIPLEDLAWFLVPQSYEEIADFQGISRYMELAICKCLIRARRAGVI